MDLAIETILLPGGKRKLTSRTSNAPEVITNQQKIRKKSELLKPTSAVETGRASMPPPIDVPTISNIPPINFELNTIIKSINEQLLQNMIIYFTIIVNQLSSLRPIFLAQLSQMKKSTSNIFHNSLINKTRETPITANGDH